MPTWGCSYKQGKSCTSSTSSSSESSDSTCTSTSNTSQERTRSTLQGRGRGEVEQRADCCSSSIPTRPSSSPAWCSRPTRRPSAAGQIWVWLGWRHLVGERLGQQGRRGMVLLEKGHRMGQVDQQSSILAACALFVFQTFYVTQSLYRPTSNFMNHPTPEAPENMKAGGWLNKCTALCHLWKNKKTDMLDKALERLSEHHSLKSSTARVERKVREEGDRAYKRFL